MKEKRTYLQRGPVTDNIVTVGAFLPHFDGDRAENGCYWQYIKRINKRTANHFLLCAHWISNYRFDVIPPEVHVSGGLPCGAQDALCFGLLFNQNISLLLRGSVWHIRAQSAYPHPED